MTMPCVARWRWTVVVVIAASLGCGHDAPIEEAEAPLGPVERIAVLSEPDRDLGPLPSGDEPVRRSACGIALALSVEGLLQPGGLKRLQARLVEAELLVDGGYRVGELDEPTITAIMRLQAREDLPIVGLPTYATVRALGVRPQAVFVTGDPTCEGPRS